MLRVITSILTIPNIWFLLYALVGNLFLSVMSLNALKRLFLFYEYVAIIYFMALNHKFYLQQFFHQQFILYGKIRLLRPTKTHDKTPSTKTSIYSKDNLGFLSEEISVT